jgi:hypothetical protein
MKPSTLVLLLAAVGLAAEASAQNPWIEHVIPAVGVNDNVLAVAVTRSSEYSWLSGHSFYVAYEVDDTVAQTHVLYLQKWDGSAFWAAPVELFSSPVPILNNPSIAASPGHVTVVGHEQIAGCQALKEFDYDVATGTVSATRVIDDGDEVAGGGCEEVGHSHIVWSPGDSTYHVCWTRKEGGVAGDEVYCAKRAATAAAWGAPESVATNGGTQDHVTLALTSAAKRRVAFHDDSSGFGTDADDARVRMYRSASWFDYDTYRVPDGTAVPQPGRQERPFVALDGGDKMHVAWEDGLSGSQVIKYVRCVNLGADGCDEDAEWEFNNVAISEAGVLSAHYPHLAVSAARTWISYQQALPSGLNDVAVLHRCLSAPNSRAWTLSDPYPAEDRDEFTEEYGTPHIATRSRGTASLLPVEVGTVTMREVLGTGRYEAVLYTRTEPVCN